MKCFKDIIRKASRFRLFAGDYADLCKLRISLFASMSALTGFSLAAKGIGSGILSLGFGVFLLSCGSCVLNHYQDRDLDAVMPRTSGRPLPSGRIGSDRALYFSLSLISLGCLLLLTAMNTMVLFLGLFTVVWYNGVYAFLKKRTAFAAVPGALTGAVPPAMGWAAGGGAIADHRLVAICFFFFMWQAPHFWLLLVDRAEEYRKAGLPSPLELLSRSQMRRIIFVWMSAASVSLLLIPMAGAVQNNGVVFFLFCASLWLVLSGVGVLRDGDEGCVPAFRKINTFVLVVMILLSLDRLLRGLIL